MTYRCDPCEGARPVARIYTSLTDGSTDATCLEDEPIMLIGHLAMALDLDPQRLYDTIQRFSEREVKREQQLLAAAQATTVVEGQQPAGDGNPFDDPEHPFHGATDLVGDAVTAGDEK